MTHEQVDERYNQAKRLKEISNQIKNYQAILSYIEASPSNTVLVTIPGYSKVVTLTRQATMALTSTLSTVLSSLQSQLNSAT